MAVLGILTLKTMVLVTFSYKSYRKTPEKPKSAKQDQPFVSILSPCYNEGPTLVNCIVGLVNQSYKNMEVLIINDGSTDDTKAVAEKLALQYPRVVRLLNIPNGGKAKALNYGLKHAKGEIVVCIDGDTIFREDTVENLVSSFSEPDVVAVAGNVRISNSNNLLTKNQSIEYITGQNLEKRTFSELNCVQVISGCIGAFRKDKVLEVGGYSSDTIVEDMDLTVTLAKKGYRVVYNPRAIAYTEAPTDIRSFMKQRYRWSYGRYEVLKKHWDMIFKREYGMLGMIGLPYYLISPWMDLAASLILISTFLIAVFTNNFIAYAINFGIFLIPLVSLILYVLYIDRIHNQNELPIYAIAQSLYYSYILNYVNVRAAIDHRRGVRATWNKLARSGTNKIPESEKLKDFLTVYTPEAPPIVPSKKVTIGTPQIIRRVPERGS